MPTGKIRVRLKAYDHRLLEDACEKIVGAAIKTGGRVVGPVPLPTRRSLTVVNRSPFTDKDSREYFEMRVHKRVIEIVNPTIQTIDALTHLDIPSGIDVTIRM
ncbi:MAG: 30S ribosomal protein S10 [Candidatus Roizmanbacteria bacterium]|uniref:Small ribosomal subunit protein uS10 n=1 Tax=Candidatus Roizmanbacteria bacterium CG10_big_fil_rev_8_21_14_0_10_45_7 TaxID=1974854 RepID=A0A2M8KUY7_9BACT|nr:30S ribosomal protein S10 [Candidatus Roizmanbacteria bacterium]PJE63673.1 MAG: 30S ribosomal protein S10 [Candidatus Roizmanbacteria bacterium CG10_big_fil_rev_8_21_14_0_10_45_7]